MKIFSFFLCIFHSTPPPLDFPSKRLAFQVEIVGEVPKSSIKRHSGDTLLNGRRVGRANQECRTYALQKNSAYRRKIEKTLKEILTVQPII